MDYSAGEIAGYCSGKLFGSKDIRIRNVLFDSRLLRNPSGVMFAAIGTRSGHGNRFLPDLYQRGVRCFLSDRHWPELPEDATLILVDNTLKALQQLAAAHRSRYSLPVIGITGSNGKTVVKEWLHHLLRDDFRMVRSPQSFNSQLGVPVSVLQLEKEHQLAVFEAGISETCEMDALEEIIRPSLGIFTHFGAAHDRGFPDRRTKAKEKCRLFRRSDVVVYCKDWTEVSEEIALLKDSDPLLQTISWSRHNKATLLLEAITKHKGGSELRVIYRSQPITLRIPFTDDAAAENAMSCLGTLLALERLDQKHLDRFATLPSLSMRLEMKEGLNNCTLINDSYSNDTDSLKAGLQFLSRNEHQGTRTLILSDLEIPEQNSTETIKTLAQLIEDARVEHLITVGPELQQYAGQLCRHRTDAFPGTAELLHSLDSLQLENKVILVKGARRFRFEQIIERLQKQSHDTRLEVNLTALAHNLRYFRSLIGDRTRLMAMVKAFAYGSGGPRVALMLQERGVDYLCVAYADEGIELRNAGITLPIMVLNCTEVPAWTFSRYRLEPVIYDLDILHRLLGSGETLPGIHIEFDSGMHRLGFMPGEVQGLAEALKHYPGTPVNSLFSHLSASDDAQHDAFTIKQYDQFITMCDELEAATGLCPMRHIANTGAILRFPQMHLDMVRLGIGLYGVDPRGTSNPELENVTTFRTRITQLKHISAGDSVGYSRKSVSEQSRMIAVLPVGYADGLRRSLSNGNGSVLINGQMAPIAGNICMDMCMADVSGIACREGDDAVIFGEEASIADLAFRAGTIPYEILTGISPRVRKVFYE